MFYIFKRCLNLRRHILRTLSNLLIIQGNKYFTPTVGAKTQYDTILIYLRQSVSISIEIVKKMRVGQKCVCGTNN